MADARIENSRHELRARVAMNFLASWIFLLRGAEEKDEKLLDESPLTASAGIYSFFFWASEPVERGEIYVLESFKIGIVRKKHARTARMKQFMRWIIFKFAR